MYNFQASHHASNYLLTSRGHFFVPSADSINTTLLSFSNDVRRLEPPVAAKLITGDIAVSDPSVKGADVRVQVISALLTRPEWF
jgi:hypothetical protein